MIFVQVKNNKVIEIAKVVVAEAVSYEAISCSFCNF